MTPALATPEGINHQEKLRWALTGLRGGSRLGCRGRNRSGGRVSDESHSWSDRCHRPFRKHAKRRASQGRYRNLIVADATKPVV